MKIILDAGHGYNTAGKRTVDGKMREWEFNNATAKYAAEYLNDYKDVEIKFVQDTTGKTDVSLTTRTNIANSWKADVYVSIHANASGNGKWDDANGIETFTYTSKSKEAVALANKVQAALIKATGRKNRGVKTADFHVLRETNMTAILIESGFMSNKEEAELLQITEYRKKVAKAIVEGIADQYNLKRKAVQTFTEKTAIPSIVYEAHIQGTGWQGKKKNGETAGTTGKSLRLEAVTVKLENTEAKLEMQGHVQGIGWTTVRTNGEVIGTIGEGLRLEAIKLKVPGLNVQYRVHVEKDGWTSWKKNGKMAGTTGQKKQIEAIQIKLS
ncbi:N-acetylmuramoyl-L-alanine amidase [Niallia nealsonii]|uniref:N-acetylmuramoyl-L-alanine amidase n=1 Tax=Niallia nealsonii TaxID=115979 RepID=A0A2N0Z012_9BACI|nr:N-acetylmuramoyl-L-alanine amidase [Niallia nealsonii]PKG22844.1 N-acetylmuramoyl-L-alanine amidase [Niallia nealsonii]